MTFQHATMRREGVEFVIRIERRDVLRTRDRAEAERLLWRANSCQHRNLREQYGVERVDDLYQDDIAEQRDREGR